MNNDPGGVAVNLKTSKILPFRSPTAPRKKRTESFASVEHMIQKLRPVNPVHVLRPHTITETAAWFTTHFPGEVMFAVKTNPDPRVLEYVWQAGVRAFDVASLAEVALVAERFPDAELFFMHPVKSREAIERAYYVYGVRHFSLDCEAELQKILEVTRNAQDLHLYVRLAIPNDKAAYSLSGKFGVSLEQAGALMQATRKAAHKMGVCFHVGSQCMDPQAYAAAVGYVRDLLVQTDITLDMVDVGGGFPSIYPGMTPPPMIQYMHAIGQAVNTLPISADCRILCEPGRALVAEGGSVVVRVELRKGNALYINDGTYGALFDAGGPGFSYPVKAVRLGDAMASELEEFSFFGPTCDSLDAMKGPFLLPSDVNEGDWIEIGQLGSYGATMRTKFNGFYSDKTVEVADAPILSLDGVQ